MRRRSFIKGTASALMTALPRISVAAPRLTTIRVGYQKSGLLALLKRHRSLEQRFAKQGIDVAWLEFAAGPPLLEALVLGRLDLGETGDTPPIFAQAAKENLVYIAAEPTNGRNEAIIVPAGSDITTLRQLKGKRVGFVRGSSSNNVIVAALESVGLSFKDILPFNVSPADGAAAFARKAIDAWVIWDPYLAIIEKRFPARILAYSGDVLQANGFLIANGTFARENPDVTQAVVEEFAKKAEWATTHLDEVAEIVADETGADRAAISAAIHRARFSVTPITLDIAAQQQATADRFFKLGLIPQPIRISEIVWHGPETSRPK